MAHGLVQMGAAKLHVLSWLAVFSNCYHRGSIAVPCCVPPLHMCKLLVDLQRGGVERREKQKLQIMPTSLFE